MRNLAATSAFNLEVRRNPGTNSEDYVRQKGKIATWNDDKGFGFIEPFDGSSRVFIHIKALGNRNRRLEQGDVVTYSVTKDSQGRTRASNATLAGLKLIKKKPRKTSASAILFALIFFGGVSASVATGNLVPQVLFWYLGASLVTYFIYARDKSSAQKGGWRTSEKTLFLFGLAGGWPGALVAQQTLRHKSKKTSFRVTFAATVIFNCVGLFWLYTADGQEFLKQVLLTADGIDYGLLMERASRN